MSRSPFTRNMHNQITFEVIFISIDFSSASGNFTEDLSGKDTFKCPSGTRKNFPHKSLYGESILSPEIQPHPFRIPL